MDIAKRQLWGNFSLAQVRSRHTVSIQKVCAARAHNVVRYSDIGYSVERPSRIYPVTTVTIAVEWVGALDRNSFTPASSNLILTEVT